MAGPRSDKDGMVAKAAGLVVFGGVAWSLYKSVAPMIFLNSKVPHGQPYHIIQGDTLFSIARSNGVSVDALKALNDLHEDDIYAGDTIVIPK